MTPAIRNGAATALEVAQQKTSLTSQRATIPALRQQEQAAINALTVLLGQTRRVICRCYRHGSWRIGAARDGGRGTPANLLERRPDLKSAALAVGQSAGADIVAARAALYPSATLEPVGHSIRRWPVQP